MHLNVTQTECKRCGKCCRKGGPALHLDDSKLLVAGRLLPVHLVTFRKGEPAWDPRNGRIIFLEKELIKIRGFGKIGACMFFDDKNRSCTVYEWRPLECRLLKCWNVKELEKVCLLNLLERQHVIPRGSILRNIIERYEEAFDLGRIYSAMIDRGGSIREDDAELNYLISRDDEFRQSLIVNFGLREEDLDFFLGRPIMEVITAMSDHLEGRTIHKKNE